MDELTKKFLSELSREHGYEIKEILRKKELELLANLAQHHKDSVIHSFNVGEDCFFIARMLGFSDKKQEEMMIKGILHDVGKVRMLTIVLDSGVNPNEGESILANIDSIRNIGLEMGIVTKDDLRRESRIDTSKIKDSLAKIKMWELVIYRLILPFYKRKHIKLKQAYQILQDLGDQKFVSIREHIRHHQDYTRVLLKKAGTNPQIIAVAARHHPEYLTESPNDIEVDIISAVDKFNAMIQSEGDRKYSEKKERAEALNYLVDGLHQKYKVVRALGKKYIPLEKKDFDPIVANMLNKFRKEIPQEKADVVKLIVRLAEWLTASKRFRVGSWFLRRKIRKELNELEKDLNLGYAR